MSIANDPLEILQGCLNDMCYVKHIIVIKKYDFKLYVGSFLLDEFVQSMQLGYLNICVNHLALLKYFFKYEPYPVPSSANHGVFGPDN